MARVGSIRTGAVIDIKAIPDCLGCGICGDKIRIGAAATLSQIKESDIFPLLGKTVGRIADHTIQCKLTLGGNLAGTIIYKESALPLLLSDCTVETYGPEGLKQLPLGRLFDRRIPLGRGEILLGAIIDREYASLPHYHAKKTPVEKIGYPVATICAIQKDERIRVALSGVCEYPFRSEGMESELNERGRTYPERAKNALGRLPTPVLSDEGAAGDYRKFVLYNALVETLKRLEA